MKYTRAALKNSIRMAAHLPTSNVKHFFRTCSRKRGQQTQKKKLAFEDYRKEHGIQPKRACNCANYT